LNFPNIYQGGDSSSENAKKSENSNGTDKIETKPSKQLETDKKVFLFFFF